MARPRQYTLGKRLVALRRIEAIADFLLDTMG